MTTTKKTVTIKAMVPSLNINLVLRRRKTVYVRANGEELIVLGGQVMKLKKVQGQPMIEVYPREIMLRRPSLKRGKVSIR